MMKNNALYSRSSSPVILADYYYQFSFVWRVPILRIVLGEEEKTVLFEREVSPVDIDDVPEMEKDEVLASSVGDGSFLALRRRSLQEKNIFFIFTRSIVVSSI